MMENNIKVYVMNTASIQIYVIQTPKATGACGLGLTQL